MIFSILADFVLKRIVVRNQCLRTIALSDYGDPSRTHATLIGVIDIGLRMVVAPQKAADVLVP